MPPSGYSVLGTGQSNLPSALSPDERSLVSSALSAARSPATVKAYSLHLRNWDKYCHSRNQVSLPARPELIAFYVVCMGQEGKSPSTIRQFLSALSAAHRDLGYDDPTRTSGVQNTLRGTLRSLAGRADHRAYPLSSAEIADMVSAPGSTRLHECRDAALILLGYASAMRRSELVRIRLSDVKFHPTGMIITIRQSKTDQYGEGQTVAVTSTFRSSTNPVAALTRWIQAAEIDREDDDEALIFRPIDRFERVSRNGLTPDAVAVILKARAAACNIDPKRVSGHSLRAGHATQAALNGVDPRVIQRTTRHKSMRSLDAYIRPILDIRESSSGHVGL